MDLPSDLPSEAVLHALATAYGVLLRDHGGAFDEAPLVLPNPEFFPAPPKGVNAVTHAFERMVELSPLAGDLELSIGLAEADGDGEACGTGGCGSGGCAPKGPPSAEAKKAPLTIVDRRDGYAVLLDKSTTSHPALLAATLARAIGMLVLLEAGESEDGGEQRLEHPRQRGSENLLDFAARAEIAAIACGFGPLLFAGSHVYAKGCGSVSVKRATALSVAEIAACTGLFVAMGDHGGRALRKYLDPTQIEAWDAATDWVSRNLHIVALLRDNPTAAAGGFFAAEAKRGFFERLFGGAPASPDRMPDAMRLPVKRRSAEDERRLAEARALVEDALGDAPFGHRAGG